MEQEILEATSHATFVAVARAGGVKALADDAGVTRASVHRWLNGEQLISAESAKKVADATDLRLADFRPDLG